MSESVPGGTISEVLDWVGDDPDRAQTALEAERAGQNRSTLISQLETIAAQKEEATVSEESSAPQEEQQVERTKEQKKLDEQGQHVVEGSEESLEAGYWGVRPTEIDDAEYALTTGPDAPYDEELGAI